MKSNPIHLLKHLDITFKELVNKEVYKLLIPIKHKLLMFDYYFSENKLEKIKEYINTDNDTLINYHIDDNKVVMIGTMNKKVSIFNENGDNVGV